MDLWLIIILGILLLTGLTVSCNMDIFEGYAEYYIPWWRRILDIPPYYSGNQLPYSDNAWYWWPYYGPQRFWHDKGEPFFMSKSWTKKV